MRGFCVSKRKWRENAGETYSDGETNDRATESLRTISKDQEDPTTPFSKVGQAKKKDNTLSKSCDIIRF